MQVVLAVGVTLMLAPLTAPIPGEIDHEIAPFTTQLSEVGPPATTEVGVAVKEVIVGFGEGAATERVRVRIAVPAARSNAAKRKNGVERRNDFMG